MERQRRMQVSAGVHAGLIKTAQETIDNDRADRIVRDTKTREYQWLIGGATSVIGLLLVRLKENGYKPSGPTIEFFKQAELLAADMVHRAWALGYIADEVRDDGEGEAVEDTGIGAEAPEGDSDAAVHDDVADSLGVVGDSAGSGGSGGTVA